MFPPNGMPLLPPPPGAITGAIGRAIAPFQEDKPMMHVNLTAMGRGFVLNATWTRKPTDEEKAKHEAIVGAARESMKDGDNETFKAILSIGLEAQTNLTVNAQEVYTFDQEDLLLNRVREILRMSQAK